MAKDKCPECPKCLPGWLVQFGDLMSLLLTFFILLLSMAVMDAKKVEEYFELFRKSLGIIDDAQNDIREQTDALSNKQSEDSGGEEDGTDYDTDNLAEQIENALKEYNETSDKPYPETMNMTKGKNDFSLDIPSALLFDGDEYKLTNRSAKKFLAKIARIIRTMPQTFSIEVDGHTDRSGYSNTTLPRDNWDISALRAIAVVKELIKNTPSNAVRFKRAVATKSATV
jgi:chemotaxis protein MotB